MNDPFYSISEAIAMMATLMRRPFAALVLAAAALGACSDGTEPVPNLLHGQWGSGQVALVAITSGAEVELQCALIVMEDGIELDADNSFSVRGQSSTYADLRQSRTVRVTGQALETGNVTLTFPDPFTGETVTHELEAGVVPVRVPNCPQPVSSRLQ